MPFSFSAARRALLLTLMLPVLFSCGKANLSPQEHLARAKDLQEKHDLQAAVIEIKNALQQDGNNAEARLMLGGLNVDMGNGAAAEKELEKARELGVSGAGWTILFARSKLLQNKFDDILNISDLNDTASAEQRAELTSLKGYANLGLGKPDAAAEFFTRALSINQKDVDALVGRAQLALAQGKPDDTRRWLDQAFAADNEAAQAWSLLGDVERQGGHLEKAEEAYTKAIQNRANKGHDLVRRALVRIALKKYPDAQKDLALLKPWSGHVADVAYASGLLELQQNHLNEAVVQFQNALKLDENYLPAKFYLGTAYYLRGENPLALEQFQTYVAKVPGDIRARQLIAILSLRNNQPDQAQKQLAAILARRPEDHLSLSLMASALLASGNTAEAVKYLRKAASLQPDAAAAKAHLGLGLLIQGEATAGAAEVESAIQLDPKMRQAELTLALYYLSQHKYDDAMKLMERLRTVMPDDATSYNVMGVIQRAKGDEAAARKSWQEALKKAPGDPAASHNLADLALAAQNIDEARKLYEGVLEKHPEHLLTIAKLAELDTATGDPGKAEARLKKAVDANPKQTAARVALARFYLSRGQATQAVETIRLAAEGNQVEPGALAVLGEAQLAAGDATNAATTLARLTKAQPAAANHYLLARALLATGNVRKADEAINEALKLDQNFFPAQLLRVQVQLGSNQLGAAKQTLARLKKAHPEHPQVLVSEAAIALRENRASDAVRALRAAMNKAPDNQTVTSLAMAQWQAGDRDGSLQSLVAWQEKHPDDLMVTDTLAKFYLLAGREADAIRTMEQVIKLNPKHLSTLNNLAWILREKDPSRALNYSEQALELAPASPQIMDTNGVVLLAQDKPDRALRVLEQAYTKASDDAGIAYHYAQALAAGNKKEEARRVLQKALNQKKAFPQRDEAQTLLNKLASR